MVLKDWVTVHNNTEIVKGDRYRLIRRKQVDSWPQPKLHLILCIVITTDHHDTYAGALKSIHFPRKKQHTAVMAVSAIVIVASDQQQFYLLVDRELNQVLEGAPRCARQLVATRTAPLPQAGQRAV